MGYHAINENSQISVYRQSDCAKDSKVGTLYVGEVFVIIGVTTGYLNVNEVRFLNSTRQFANGFIDSGRYGNLAFSGKSVSISKLGGTCYRFKLRKALSVVYNNGNHKESLSAGDYVYTNDAYCGSSNPRNMHIVGYKKGTADIKAFSGFVTLDYTSGSMFASNFCLYKA